jgi:hypothetical protein
VDRGGEVDSGRAGRAGVGSARETDRSATGFARASEAPDVHLPRESLYPPVTIYHFGLCEIVAVAWAGSGASQVFRVRK